MPASPPSRGSVRRTLTIAALVLAAAGAYGFREAGRFLDAEDPLQKADAILVLAGARMERAIGAADLQREGWAPLIVMTRQTQDPGVSALNARGLALPSDEEFARDALVRDGIPSAAFLLPDRIHDNTAQEAQTLHRLASSRGWRRVIVVSSKFHLRRAAYAMRRELEGSGVAVVMHGSRYDAADPPRWWRTRRDIRWMLSEGPKVVAYLLGLGA